MIDIAEWRATAEKLRKMVCEIEHEGAQGRYPTSRENAGLINKAAQALDDACSEIARLQEEQSK